MDSSEDIAIKATNTGDSDNYAFCRCISQHQQRVNAADAKLATALKDISNYPNYVGEVLLGNAMDHYRRMQILTNPVINDRDVL